MATLTVSAAPGRTVLDVTADAMQSCAGGGDAVDNADGKTMLLFNNAGGNNTTLTVAFSSNAAVDGTSPPNKTFNLAAGKYTLIGPFTPFLYNNTSNNRLVLTYSAVTSLKVIPFYSN